MIKCNSGRFKPKDPWRVFEYITKLPNNCWETKFKGTLPHKTMHVPSNTEYGSHKVYVHKVAYQLYYGVILPRNPKDAPFVLHKCHNPLCVNPLHLYLGSRRDNAKDRKEYYISLGKTYNYNRLN